MAKSKNIVLTSELLKSKKKEKTTIGVRVDVEVVEKVRRKGYKISVVVQNLLRKLAEEG